MIPDFRLCCPICGGCKCPVRHGVYYRRVVSHGVILERFPVPRFRCRNLGSREGSAVTFSVLPEQLLPRKQPSLSLAVWMLHRLLVSYTSLSKMLDELAEIFHRHREPWLPDASTIYRLLRLFARARTRVTRLPKEPSAGRAGPESRPAVGEPVKHRALEMLSLLADDCGLLADDCGLLADDRGSPIVGRYHRAFFPKLLFAPIRPIRKT